MLDVVNPVIKTFHGLASKLEQLWTGRHLLRQPGIEHLLKRPGGFTKLGKTDHSGTTLEGVERSPQAGLLIQVSAVATKSHDSTEAAAHDISGLIQKDGAQLGIVILSRNGIGTRRRQGRIDQRYLLRNSGDRRGRYPFRRNGRLSHLAAIDRQCHIRAKLQRDSIIRQFFLTPHQGPKFTQRIIVDKEFFGKLTLIAQHVNQKSKRTQTVTQFLESPRMVQRCDDVVNEEPFNTVTHTQCGQRCLVQPQDRKNPPHLCQSPRHLMQGHFFIRSTEKSIQGCLYLSQRGTKLINHAAHDLPVTDTAIELLHPRVQWFRLSAVNHMIKPLGEPVAALDHLLVRWIQILISGLQIQHSGRHLHCQRRPRCTA